MNGIRVLATNIEADNGLIHLIHGVLLPEESDDESPGEDEGEAATGEDIDTPSDDGAPKGAGEDSAVDEVPEEETTGEEAAKV